MEIRTNVPAAMRDGTLLRSDFYVPSGKGRFPTLLCRTLYDKTLHEDDCRQLCHGIVRARYRDYYESPTLIEPGRLYKYNIQVNPTSNLFRPGHRIQAHLSSSDFPNFDRSHNTGGDDHRESTLLTARQTIFHDSLRPSHIVLPVIPN